MVDVPLPSGGTRKSGSMIISIDEPGPHTVSTFPHTPKPLRQELFETDADEVCWSGRVAPRRLTCLMSSALQVASEAVDSVVSEMFCLKDRQ